MRGAEPVTHCRAVVLHPDAAQVAPELVAALQQAFGDDVLFLPAGKRRVWVQDYFPLILRRQGGTLEQVTFLSTDAGESDFFFEDIGADVRRLPLRAHGGALCALGPRAFVSRTLVDENRVWPRDEAAVKRLRRRGFTPREEPAVRALVADALDLDVTAVHVLPPMPGEATGHLTPYLRGKGGDPPSVLVPELDEAAFAEIGFPHEIGLGRLVQTFLDVQAAELESLGLDVTRLPMLPPIDLDKSERPEGWTGRVHSAAAVPLIDIRGVRRAFVPSFQDAAFPEGYRRLKRNVLEQWQAFYDDEGFTPVVVDATEAARAGGSLVRLLGLVPA